jgi:Mrp family chromosome partitioning ATPase
MTSMHYRDLLLRHWRLLLLCMVLAGCGAGIGSFFLPAVYQSTVVIEVVISPANGPLLTSPVVYIQTQMHLATSDAVLSEVAATHSDVPLAQLRNEVSTAAITNTHLFQIIVQDAYPQRAQSLAMAVANAVIEQQQQTTAQSDQQSQALLKNDLATTESQIATTTQQLNQAESSKTPDQQQITTLKAQLEALQAQQSKELDSLTLLQRIEAEYASSLRIAQAAQPGVSRSHTYLFISIAAGLLFGLTLGGGFIFLRGLLNQRIRTTQALVTWLDWPVLAEINIPTARYRVSPVEEENQQADTPFEALAQGLAFLAVDAPIFSLLVTSVFPNEGASQVASELALFLAEQQQRVLLLEADLEHPTYHRSFEIKAKPGLGTALLDFNDSGEEWRSVRPYLRRVTTQDAPGLRVIPAGPPPPNPAALLRSRAMRAFFDALSASEAESRVLAGPPLSKSSGVGDLAALVDGVLVVVDLARARRDALLRAKTFLAQIGVRVLGCVVVQVPLDALEQSAPPKRDRKKRQFQQRMPAGEDRLEKYHFRANKARQDQTLQAQER